MTHPSKRKGNSLERDLVNEAREKGLEAKRVPLSGAAEGYPGDVIVHSSWGSDYCIEAKWRGDGFKQIYGWLQHKNADALVIKADHQEPLCIIPYTKFLDLLQ